MTKPMLSILLVATLAGCDAGGAEAGRFTAQIRGGPIATAEGAAFFFLHDAKGPALLRAVYLVDETDLNHRFIVLDGRAEIDGVGVYEVDWGPPEGHARIEYNVDTETVRFGTDVARGTLTITRFDRSRVQGRFEGTLDLSPIDIASEARVAAEFDAEPYADG